MAFDYQVSLQVYHANADPADIVDALAIPASRSWKAGDRRSAPNGAELSGHYRESYCLFRLGDGNDGELAKCLRGAVRILQPKRHYLDWLRETGGRMNFYLAGQSVSVARSSTHACCPKLHNSASILGSSPSVFDRQRTHTTGLCNPDQLRPVVRYRLRDTNPRRRKPSRIC